MLRFILLLGTLALPSLGQAQPQDAVPLTLEAETHTTVAHLLRGLAPGQTMSSPFRGGAFRVRHADGTTLQIEVSFPRNQGTWQAWLLHRPGASQLLAWGTAATGRPLEEWEIRTIYSVGCSRIWRQALATVYP